MPHYRYWVVAGLAIVSLTVQGQSDTLPLLSESVIVLTTESEHDPQAREEKEKLLKFANSANNDKEARVPDLRRDALANIAYDWGLNEGLYFFHSRNQANIVKQTTLLDVVADFSPFVINGKLLLPMVSRANRAYEQVSDDQARTFSVSYTLEAPAKIVNTPPSWRDYLFRPLAKPEKPSSLLLPRTNQERQQFEYEFERGWDDGKQQAETILEQDYHRLETVLARHWNFRELALQNIVRLPTVSQTRLATVTSVDGKTINVNDVIYQIERPSQWEALDKWQPIFRPRQ